MKPGGDRAHSRRTDTTTIPVCPLACLPFHSRYTVMDSGRECGTVCELCQQVVTREEWLEVLLGEEVVS